MKPIKTHQAPAAIGPYSQGVCVGDFVFCSGQIGIDPSSGELVGDQVEQQTVQIFKNIHAILQKAGLTPGDIVKTTVFLKNMDDFSRMNAVYERCLKSHKPARSTVEVSRLPKNALVEIECIVTKR